MDQRTARFDGDRCTSCLRRSSLDEPSVIDAALLEGSYEVREIDSICAPRERVTLTGRLSCPVSNCVRCVAIRAFRSGYSGSCPRAYLLMFRSIRGVISGIERNPNGPAIGSKIFSYRKIRRVYSHDRRYAIASITPFMPRQTLIRCDKIRASSQIGNAQDVDFLPVESFSIRDHW